MSNETTSFMPNRARLFKSFFFGSRAVIYPTAVYVEPTNKCNLKCSMCPNEKMTRPRGVMDFGLFRRVVGEMRGRVQVLILHFMGESLIHPHLPEMVALAHEAGLFVQMSTNGALLTESIAEAIMEAGLDILSIDFDGDSPEGYERTRVNASFPKLLCNIHGAVAMKKKLGSSCAIVLQVIMFPGQHGDLTAHLSPGDLKCVQIRRKLFNDTFKADGRPIAHKRACFHLWNDMTVAWNGNVALCCVDFDCQEVLGNLDVSSIKEIWNGEMVSALRRRHRALDYCGLPVCELCALPNQQHFKPLYVGASLLFGAKTTRRLMTPALNLLQHL